MNILFKENTTEVLTDDGNLVLKLDRKPTELGELVFNTSSTGFTLGDLCEWARVTGDFQLEKLDMDICCNSRATPFTALAIGVWNAAITEAAKKVDHILAEGGKAQGDLIRELRK